MIILDATTEKLQLVLGGAITTNQLEFTTSYIDIDVGPPATFTPINNDGSSNDTSDVDIVGATGAATTQRQVKYISVYNKDTVNATVTIKKDTSGTDKILCVVTLATGDTLQYSSGRGFSVIASADGSEKIQPQTPIGISAGTQSVSTGTAIFSNSNRVTFAMSGSSQITADQPRLSMSFYEAGFGELQAFSIATGGSGANVANLSIQRFLLPYNMTVTRLDLLAVMTLAGTGGGTAGSWTISVGLYTRSQSTLFTFSTTSQTSTWNAAGASNNSDSAAGQTGTRLRTIAPASWQLTPGEYWFAIINSVNGPAGTTPAISYYGQSSVSIVQLPGGINDTYGMNGVYSAGTGAFPAQMHLTRTDIFFGHSAAASASMVNRQPFFRMYGTY